MPVPKTYTGQVCSTTAEAAASAADAYKQHLESIDEPSRDNYTVQVGDPELLFAAGTEELFSVYAGVTHHYEGGHDATVYDMEVSVEPAGEGLWLGVATDPIPS